MAEPQRDHAPYRAAIKPRLAALERVFGPKGLYLVSPIPLPLGGRPTLVGLPGYLPDADVFCTSEMTGGWGSGQKPGPHGEYELVMVVKKGSALAPETTGDQLGKQGFVGSILTDLAKHSTQAVLKHGETAGPLDPRLAPMSDVLFVDLTNPKVPFQFRGQAYGLLLVVLINDEETRLREERSAAELIARLRKATVFPVSDLARPSVA
jgi:hypothetical protein